MNQEMRDQCASEIDKIKLKLDECELLSDENGFFYALTDESVIKNYSEKYFPTQEEAEKWLNMQKGMAKIMRLLATNGVSF